MKPIKLAYAEIANLLIQHSVQPASITVDNLYQEANYQNREILDKGILTDLLHSSSTIINWEELEKLHELAKQGHSCIIFMEHYSNFDLPNFIHLIEAVEGKQGPISNSIIAIAGVKLNSESNFVRSFTEAYTRIIIYPSWRLTRLLGTENFEREFAKSREINKEGYRLINQVKEQGKIILVFPTGTRYRKNFPETQQILPEVYTFIKKFDYFLPIGIAGNTLHINDEEDMSSDLVTKDCCIYFLGRVTETKRWRQDLSNLVPKNMTIKQFFASCISKEFKILHYRAEQERQKVFV